MELISQYADGLPKVLVAHRRLAIFDDYLR